MDSDERQRRGYYADRSLDRAIKDRDRKKPINFVFIEPDTKPLLRPFCSLCGCYMVYIKEQGYECPRCHTEYTDENEDPDRLKSKYKTEPIAAQIGRKNKPVDRSDYPARAHITEDVEHSAIDQSETIMIEDNKDV